MAHNPTTAHDLTTNPETETKAEIRERQPLAPWAEVYEGATCIRLGYVSFKEANGKYKATYGGLMAGYVDPVSGQPCFFAGKDGSRIAGSVSVRLFDGEAEQFLSEVGLTEVGEDLMLVGNPERVRHGDVWLHDSSAKLSWNGMVSKHFPEYLIGD